MITEKLNRDIIGTASAMGAEPGGNTITFGKFADVSSNVAFVLAKQLRKKPADIASGIASALNTKGYDASSEGGFVNVNLSDDMFDEEAEHIFSSANYGRKEQSGKKVNLEFISANPTGPLVLVNARAGIVGNFLASVFNYSGWKAERENYINDGGMQIENLGRSVLNHLNSECEFPENGYRGAYVKDIAEAYAKEHSTECTDENIAACSRFAADRILEWQKRTLEHYGLEFENWIYESRIRESGEVEKAYKLLEDKGMIYENEGAKFFRSSAFKDSKDRVVVKSDGNYSYLMPDIAYHFDKVQRGYDRIIDILGPDHHGYIDRITAAVKVMDENLRFDVVLSQLITLYRDGKKYEMSKRMGDFITMDELAEEIDIDVLKFMFLVRKLSQPYDFDIDKAKEQTMENPVYYVQYAHARICSIYGKAEIDRPEYHSVKKAISIPEGRALLSKLLQYPYVVYSIAENYEIQKLPVYLSELSELVHKFYHEHRVISEDTEDMKSKLALLECARKVIAGGLNLMGIEPRERMDRDEV